jgi:transglutaminase-like putative cysteine protease
MKRISRILMLTLCFFGSVQAQQLPSPHIKVTLADMRLEFDSAEVMRVLTTIEMQALTPEGAQRLTKAQVGFNSALQRMEIVQAKTIKADGQQINVQPNGLAVQKGYSAPGVGVTVPEWHVQEINFPDVKAGDKVLRSVRMTSIQPQLPGFQQYQDYLLPSIAYDAVSVRIEAPRSMNLSLAANPTLTQSIEGDKQVWTGKTSIAAAPMDDNPSSIRRLFPHLMVSTVPSQEELGRRFTAEMVKKASVTPEVIALAKQVAGSATTDEQKVKAVYDWVRKEIKYVALFLGVGGWVPHDTKHILEKRYGDCKDHVTLMMAMLKALDVPTQAALINTFAHYEMDPVAVGFNHVISYVPSLDKFLDPTDTNAPYSSLPFSAYGKPVVVSDGSMAQIRYIPALKAVDNTLLTISRHTIKADGSAELSLKVKGTGYAASVLQNQLSQIPAGLGAEAVQRILKDSNLRGSGSLRYDKINRDIQEQSFEADVSISDALRQPDAGVLGLNPSLNTPIYILRNMGNYQQERRTLPYVCNSVKVREEFTMELEAGFKLSRIPTPLIKDIEGIRFESSHQQTGNTITGWRELEISHPKQECSPEEYRRRRLTMLEIVRHLRAQMLYER